ncbi:cytochrome P450 [Corallococcus sp. M7]
MTALPPLPTARTCPFDPPPEYRRLRVEQPISRVVTPRGDPAWLVTRHEDIRAVLTDRRFSSNPLARGYPSYVTGDVPPPPGFFMQMDAPDHTRLRALVTREFMARHIESLRPRMQAIVDRRVDALLHEPQPADLIKAFALPTASAVICELLGVPFEDAGFVQSRTDGVLDRSRTAKESETSAIELMGYFDRLVSTKEQAPGDDILGRLISDKTRSEQVTHAELVGIAALLMLGGYDTMAQVIGLGTVTLLQHPEQLADFLRDPSLADGLVEELVRYLTVNHAGLPRAATADVEVGGQLIREGEGLIVMLSSGNRDEQAFPNADAFDIRRDCRHQVGFGHGLHRCIGATFARAELAIVFRSLFERIPSLRVAVPVEELAFRHEMVLYGLKQLPVAWSAASPSAGPQEAA